jgi:hypothetical protein
MQKDLRLFSPGMSATFTVPRATTLWNHRLCKAAQLVASFIWSRRLRFHSGLG